MTMRMVEKDFRVHVQGCEFRGVSVLNDGTVHHYEEQNPRDVYWTELTRDEVLKGKENKAIRDTLGAELFAELMAYLKKQKYSKSSPR